MKVLTKKQYQTVFLYSKGLTFSEIDILLHIKSKAYYSQVLYKDKGRITRAKISREKNKFNYTTEQNNYLQKIKKQNKMYKDYANWIKDNCIIPIPTAKKIFREDYLKDSLYNSCKSYNKYRLTFIKKALEKVA
jgi:hypothetical protein